MLQTRTPVEGTVGGTVPATLSLALGAPASFGAFTPGVAKDYTASTTATVTSTAGDAALSASTARLTNGAFSLAQPVASRPRRRPGPARRATTRSRSPSSSRSVPTSRCAPAPTARTSRSRCRPRPRRPTLPANRARRPVRRARPAWAWRPISTIEQLLDVRASAAQRAAHEERVVHGAVAGAARASAGHARPSLQRGRRRPCPRFGRHHLRRDLAADRGCRGGPGGHRPRRPGHARRRRHRHAPGAGR